jgi:signal transduction histidine kinase
MNHNTKYQKDKGLFKEERSRSRNRYNDGISGAEADLTVYLDNDGLPVTYDSASSQRKEQIMPDELSMLWHEILSPLTVIKGYTGTLLDLSHVISEEQKKQYLRGIEAANNRMIRLMENLRDISHLENSDTWVIHSVYLNDIFQRIVPEIQSQANKHVIKILPIERLPLVKVEPDKIEQVLVNLITNAIKYSPQGGEITIDVRLIHDKQEKRSMFADAPPISFPSLVVSIADDGIGIPEEELESIFQRFYRVNNQIIKSTPGAGLGLYICQLIIEGHGGRIWARNRSQGGSVFSFSLPLEQRVTRRYKDYH